MPKQLRSHKRSREEDEVGRLAAQKRRRRSCKQEATSDECFFVHTTVEMMCARSQKGSETSSGDSSPSYESAASIWSDDGKGRSASTPLSSLSGDIPIDPEVLSHGEVAPGLVLNDTNRCEFISNDGSASAEGIKARI